MDDKATETPIDTRNEFAVLVGTNLANHSQSMAGRGKFVQVGGQPIPPLRTKQQAFRLAAWIARYAEAYNLPDEATGAHTFEEVYNAIEI